MKYFLGIDGGGTKTAYLLIDENGECLAEEKTGGCSYKEIGIEKTAALLKEGASACLKKAGLIEDRLSSIVVGLPCFGELKVEDGIVSRAVKEIFMDRPIHITNDVEVGWAGSLGLQPGVNVVAGTGSIAFGKNEAGLCARSGGWSTFFGDEGSCYWLGRRTMELFSKQADGRVRRGPLYDIIKEEFSLDGEMDFIGRMDQEYIGERSKVASMQRLLLRAARQGDVPARRLYQEAAEELGSMAGSILKKLWDRERVPVSYSGGLFHAEEFVLPFLKRAVEEQNGYLLSPMFSPVEGAALMAVNSVAGTKIHRVIENWMSEKRK